MKPIPDKLYAQIIEAIPIVSADTVVISNRSVLLLKRTVEPLWGFWCLPGGMIHLGETPKKAAVRKLREETGIELREKELIGEKVVTYFHPGRQNVTVTYVVYSDHLVVRLNEDHSDYRWVGFSDLGGFNIWSTTMEQIRWALGKDSAI